MKMNAAVIGSPISHSLSPEIFAFLSRRASGMELSYRAVDVSPVDLQSQLIEFSHDPFFIGSNVTVPHKESVLQSVDEVTPIAKSARAANVLHRKDGRWIAHNTDVYGISESLGRAGQQLFEAEVLIIGAGGAARAAGVAAGAEKARRVHFINRTHARAAGIVHDLAPLFPECDFYAPRDLNELQNFHSQYSIVVQTTTLGMKGIAADAKQEFAPILDAIRNRPFGFELIYQPEETEFLRQCKARGWSSMGGLSMLAHQALATWSIWFPKLELPKETPDELIAHLRNYLERIDGTIATSNSNGTRNRKGEKS